MIVPSGGKARGGPFTMNYVLADRVLTCAEGRARLQAVMGGGGPGEGGGVTTGCCGTSAGAGFGGDVGGVSFGCVGSSGVRLGSWVMPVQRIAARAVPTRWWGRASSELCGMGIV